MDTGNPFKQGIAVPYKKDTEWKYVVIVLFLAALLLRICLAVTNKGHESDIICFQSWADLIYEHGFSEFYKLEVFTDYPPGYMYCLYLIGFIKKIFHITTYSVAGNILIKMPAIICDLGAGYLIYRITNKRIYKLSYTALYLFNPAILINSSVWGQVDSVFTLFVFIMCYYITKKNLPKAYFAFALGILIKPQTLIFTPVLILGIVDQVFLKNFRWRNFYYQLKYGLLAIASMVLLILPFGLQTVMKQYSDTLTSYKFASVNAYNIWTMFGLNWATQDGKFLFFTFNQWGTLFICLIVASVVFVSFRCKNDSSKYFLIGAFIVIGMFLFSVRMHERYMFPSLVLLLVAFIWKPRKELFLVYCLFSMAHFFNVAHVLFFYDYQNFSPKAVIPICISAFTLIVFCILLYVIKKYYWINTEEAPDKNIKKREIHMKRENSMEKIKITSSEPFEKLKRFDVIAMIVITVIYACFALYDLGDRKAPTTSWETQMVDTPILIDLGEKKPVHKLAYFIGNYENREFSLESADTPNGIWTFVADIKMSDVFSWEETDINSNDRYLRLTSKSDKAVIFEMVIIGDNDEIVKPTALYGTEQLFDEQDLYPGRSTFRDSTYFDEIYHARTAYEFIHGLYSYENTHPPLGKIFISIGMLIFGVNPFGWRIMGTLFGIAMLPFIYLFAKRLMKESWLATIVTILFAFDFMHFAQTRIATIDVFVTFFIILMYYFMYQYTRLSFYDTSLKRTFIPLGLSGVSMGLGMACKWTGVYAAGGLAIIFFLTLFQRYREYTYAVRFPNDTTSHIEHQHVIHNFKSNTIKTILFCVLFFVVIPIIIYTLSYLPFVDAYGRDLIGRMIKNQDTMFHYHSNVVSTHPYSSWWFQWPIMYRPIWYYSGHVTTTVSEGISAFGNPMIWWAGIPAFVYMVYLSVKHKDKKAIFLVIGYLAQYLPWVLVTRITFIYHYFPSVPFVTLMIGYSIGQIVKINPKMKKVAFIYTGIAVLLFIMFYPVLSGQPVDKNYVSMWLRWFDSWVLVS